MEALSIVASLFTIWAQSSILAENKEFDRFKDAEQQIEHQQMLDEQEQRQRKLETLEARLVVLTETRL